MKWRWVLYVITLIALTVVAAAIAHYGLYGTDPIPCASQCQESP